MTQLDDLLRVSYRSLFLLLLLRSLCASRRVCVDFPRRREEILFDSRTIRYESRKNCPSVFKRQTAAPVSLLVFSADDERDMPIVGIVLRLSLLLFILHLSYPI